MKMNKQQINFWIYENENMTLPSRKIPFSKFYVHYIFENIGQNIFKRYFINRFYRFNPVKVKRKNFIVWAKFSPVTELRRIIGRKNSLNIETILITINLFTLQSIWSTMVYSWSRCGRPIGPWWSFRTVDIK